MEPPRSKTPIDNTSNPKPVIWHKQRYCPDCWRGGIKTRLIHPRQFLCKKHYGEYRRKREANRINRKNRARQGTTSAPPYITHTGTGVLGKTLRKKNRKPDFKAEQEKIQKEKKRVFGQRTPGDIANKLAGGLGESHLPEIEEYQKPAYTPDMDGIIYYGKPKEEDIYGSEGEHISDASHVIDIDETKTDDWRVTEDVDKFFKEPRKEKKKPLAEKYKDWEY